MAENIDLFARMRAGDHQAMQDMYAVRVKGGEFQIVGKVTKAQVKEIAEAKSVVITVPLWNWSIPSVLKAYVDHIVLIGALDPYTNRKLAGKKVTIFIGAGGGYGPGSAHPEWEFITPYLTHIFTSLGSEDVQVIRAEFSLAGVAPGMESLVPNKEKSLADGIAAAEARAASI